MRCILTIVSLMLIGSIHLLAQDTIPLPNFRLGANFEYRSIKNQSPYVSYNGYSTTAGFYIEKIVLQRISLNSGFYFQYLNNKIQNSAFVENMDNVKIHHYGYNDYSGSNLVVPLSAKCYYTQNYPLLYIQFGIEGIFNVEDNTKWQYQISEFYDNGTLIEERVVNNLNRMDDRIKLPAFCIDWFVGLGGAIGKRWNIDVTARTRGVLNKKFDISAVIGYQLLGRQKKSKRVRQENRGAPNSKKKTIFKRDNQ